VTEQIQDDTDAREISLNLRLASTSFLINLRQVVGANGHHEVNHADTYGEQHRSILISLVCYGHTLSQTHIHKQVHTTPTHTHSV